MFDKRTPGRASCVVARFVIGFVALGCGGRVDGGEDVVVHTEEELAISWEEYRDAARTVIGGHTFFNVEGDLYFDDEAELRRYYDSLFENETEKLAVWVRPSDAFEPTFKGAAALNIRYCISNQFQTTYSPFDKNRVIADMSAATRAWEDVANVRFVYLSGQDATCTDANTNVDFAVMPTIDAIGGCAASKLLWYSGCPLPTGFSPRGVLTMGGYTNIPSPPGPVGVLRHELGHILGFRHEHPWKGATSGCGETQTNTTRTGRRLTGYDNQSIMHYMSWPNGCEPNVHEWVLTESDGVGARSVYGIPAAWYLAIL